MQGNLLGGISWLDGFCLIPSLEGNSLLNSLIAISHVEFACFRLAAGGISWVEFLWWKPLVSPCFSDSWVDFP